VLAEQRQERVDIQALVADRENRCGILPDQRMGGEQCGNLVPLKLHDGPSARWQTGDDLDRHNLSSAL
jgi:hypothetical protein